MALAQDPISITLVPWVPHLLLPGSSCPPPSTTNVILYVGPIAPQALTGHVTHQDVHVTENWPSSVSSLTIIEEILEW